MINMVYYYCPVCNQKFSNAREEAEHSKTHRLGEPGKINPEPVNNNSEPEKKEFRPLDFMKRYLNKDIEIQLINGEVLKGKMTGYNSYDVMIDGKLLLPKHSILYMTETEKITAF